MAGPNILNFANKVVFLNGSPITLPTATSNPGTATAGDMYYNSTSNTINYYNGSTWIVIGDGDGTVTSVGLAEGSEGDSQTIFTFGGTNPITASGTINISLASQSANTVLIGRNGNSGQPYFRLLMPADLPSTITSDTTGTASNITSTILAPSVITSSLTSLGTQTSALDMGGYGIINVLDPVNPQDAATKHYVDLTYANITLSNLGTTAVNADLLPAAANTQSLGSASLNWLNVFTGTVQTTAINDNAGNEVILMYTDGTPGDPGTGYFLIDPVSGNTALDWSNRFLEDSTGTIQIAFSATGAASQLGTKLAQLTAGNILYLDANQVIINNSTTASASLVSGSFQRSTSGAAGSYVSEIFQYGVSIGSGTNTFFTFNGPTNSSTPWSGCVIEYTVEGEDTNSARIGRVMVVPSADGTQVSVSDMGTDVQGAGPGNSPIDLTWSATITGGGSGAVTISATTSDAAGYVINADIKLTPY